MSLYFALGITAPFVGIALFVLICRFVDRYLY